MIVDDMSMGKSGRMTARWSSEQCGLSIGLILGKNVCFGIVASVNGGKPIYQQLIGHFKFLAGGAA